MIDGWKIECTNTHASVVDKLCDFSLMKTVKYIT